MIGYGYDPARLLALRAGTHEVILHLERAIAGEVRHDPDAADALRAARLTIANLVGQWVPLLDRIIASDAMVSWRAAGPDGDALAEVVRRLVGTFDARAAWRPLSPHFDRSTAEVARGLAAAAAAHREVVDHGGALDLTRAELLTWAAEAADRAGSPAAAAILQRTLGADGLASVLRAVEQDTELAQLGLLPVELDVGLGPAVVRLLDGIAAVNAASARFVVERVTASAALASVVAASAHRLTDALVGSLTRGFVLGLAGHPLWSGTPGVIDRTAAAEALVRVLAERADVARSLLQDVDVARALATETALDPTTTEALWAAALGRPGGRAGSGGEGELTARLEVLATLTQVAMTDELSAGTRRGVARGIAPLLPTLSPHLDRRLPVYGTWTDGTIVEIGPYEEVANLVGQVVDDADAQRSLGVSIRAFLHDQLATAAVDVRRSPAETAADAALHVAGRLADVSRVVDLVVDGAAERDALLEFRHGVATEGANLLLAVGSMGLGWVLAPTAPISARVAALTTRGVQHALGQAAPREVTDGDVQASVARQVLAEVLALPATDPAARDALGLADLPPAVWDELIGTLAGRGEAGVGGDPRHAQLQRLVDAHPELDRYVETVLSVGRDADRD